MPSTNAEGARKPILIFFEVLPAEGTTAAFDFLRKSARSAGGSAIKTKQILCLSEGAAMSAVKRIAGQRLLNAQSWRLIIVWLEVRVLPAPPRSLKQTEISGFGVNSPELAGIRVLTESRINATFRFSPALHVVLTADIG